MNPVEGSIGIAPPPRRLGARPLSTAARSLIEDYMGCCEEAGLPLCALRVPEDFPDSAGGDIDLFPDADRVREYHQVLAAVCLRNGWSRIHAHVRSYFFALYLRHDCTGEVLHLDLYTHPTEWHGATYLSPSDLFQNSVRRHGHQVAHPADDAVVNWLTSVLWGGFTKRRYRPEIEAATARFRDHVRRALHFAIGSRLASELLELVDRGEIHLTAKRSRPLRRAVFWRSLRRNTATTVQRWLLYWVTELRLLLHPPGIYVAVYGPDGVGKSSVLSALERSPELNAVFADTTLLHFRPTILKARSSSDGPVEDPHSAKQRSVLFSVAKSFYYALDYIVGYWSRVCCRTRRNELVLFDRYFDDLLVDPYRYRSSAPSWLLRLIGRLVPKPDLVFTLDAPAEVTHARKAELPLEELRRQRDAYRDVHTAEIIDADRPLDEVVASIQLKIRHFLAERSRETIRAVLL